MCWEKMRVGFVLQKRGKKQGKNTKIPLRKGDFTHKRSQIAPYSGAPEGVETARYLYGRHRALQNDLNRIAGTIT